MILLTIFSLSFLCQRINASGVFELEFIKLQPLIDISTSTENSTKSSPEQQQVPGQFVSQENPSNLVRILVCLKEAFTSQLDGPCTFGNASITLNRDSMQQSNTNHHQDYSSNKQTSAQQQQQRGSQLTNIVRILFTFRWTVSSILISIALYRPYLHLLSAHLLLLNRILARIIEFYSAKVQNSLPVGLISLNSSRLLSCISFWFVTQVHIQWYKQ